MSALLEINDLKKHFPVGRSFLKPSAWVYAVDGVSFEIVRGETLALVGESGCGKSTVGRAILRLFDVTAGQVVLDGRRIDDLSPGALRPLRRRVQVVFQDPFASLNPRMRVRDILAEPMRNFALAASPTEMEARVDALLHKVRLPRAVAQRWPHELSGGQRQRAPFGGAGARARRGARAHHPQGRRAEPDQSAQGLPLPHPLPLCLRPLPHRGTEAAAAARRSFHRLPPARSAGGAESAGVMARLAAGRAPFAYCV